MDDDLDLEARALVQQARAGDRPPPAAVRRRVRQAVWAAVPGAALGTGVTAAHAASGATLTAKIGAAVGAKLVPWVVGGFVLSLGATTVGYVAWSESEPRHGPAMATGKASGHPTAASTAPPPAAAPVPVRADVPPAAARTVVAGRRAEPVAAWVPTPAGTEKLDPKPPHAATTHSRSALAQQAELLGLAQRQLRDGKAESVLELLHRHDIAFAHSQLRPDFEVTRILAWCEMGRRGEARKAAERFLEARPDSPLASRVRHCCAFESEVPRPLDPGEKWRKP